MRGKKRNDRELENDDISKTPGWSVRKKILNSTQKVRARLKGI